MKDLIWVPRAEMDLEEIWRYTAVTWSADQADAYITTLVEYAIEIAKGTKLTLPADHIREGYRRAVAGSHVLYIREQQDVVEVVRVLHYRREPRQHLA